MIKHITFPQIAPRFRGGFRRSVMAVNAVQNVLGLSVLSKMGSLISGMARIATAVQRLIRHGLASSRPAMAASRLDPGPMARLAYDPPDFGFWQRQKDAVRTNLLRQTNHAARPNDHYTTLPKEAPL